MLNFFEGMDSPFGGPGDNNKKKLEAAKECIIAIFSHLTPKDNMGIVLFSDDATVGILFRFYYFIFSYHFFFNL